MDDRSLLGLFAIYLVLNIPVAALTAWLASEKDRRFLGWALLGLLLSLPALLAVGFAPTRRPWRCAECGERVHEEAKVCRYCGSKEARPI
jgi:hypothetical protein